ncbi:ATP-binding protein [Treponema pedis]|uniref:ATP-binding protein n=3 Tax=Treponema pedis TaxID=409322 RepID=A0A7S6WRU3_9SPIR|nr:ATP-binding protein [Treponema pedis]QOW62155.1 ATP-binding protein [Treponema pedis]
MDFSRRLPIGVQSFEVMRSDKFLYVDKTEFVYRLVNSSRVYFLSRPRRFGKSLFLSTLKAYFSGQKELFKNLVIEDLENSQSEPWKEYPVFYLDFNVGKYDCVEALTENLDLFLKEKEEEYNLPVQNTLSYAKRFAVLLKTVYEKTGKQIVFLVDEYDKPLLQTMNVNEKLNEEYRAILKAFYSVLKSSDSVIRFAFLTGVTKFSKVSIFSDLNNLNDISLKPDYSGICGITQSELENTFKPEIEILAERNKLSYEQCIKTLKQNYDGYCFADGTENMYNPFSLLNVFDGKQFEYYWFATGTPTFLVNALREANYNIPDLDGNVEMDASGLSDYRAGNDSAIPILFQAGYLTIKSYDSDYKMYRLGFPNDEVRYGFLHNLLPAYSNLNFGDTAFSVVSFTKDLRAGRVEEFMQRLKSIMASMPYDNVKKESGESLALREHNFQICVYLVFALMGQFVKTETHCAGGRSDCTVESENTIYIFEFKLKGSAEEALKQIREKNYAEAYRTENKEIVLIGVSFNAEEKTVGEWLTEKA